MSTVATHTTTNGYSALEEEEEEGAVLLCPQGSFFLYNSLASRRELNPTVWRRDAADAADAVNDDGDNDVHGQI